MSTRILLVDDDTALSEMVGMTLESGGYDVVYCADGTHALQAFTINQPELVLLDLMLPGMDGIEICRRIRAISDVPIIMLTARSDTQDVVAGLEAGADDY
ncbi:MAG: response regulator, partial [Actinomyces graevenitzii]|nr:response regulator [Actinomyces graevenitzii]